MSRYDKYSSLVSGTRAAAAADMGSAGNAVDNTWLGRAFGVGLDANGRVVKGAGTTGIIGVLVLTRHVYAGDILDIMDLGEVVEFDPVTAGTLAPAATTYYAAAADGALSTTNTGAKVGYTVEAGRLRVHMGL
jgi:hypothetical protein